VRRSCEPKALQPQGAAIYPLLRHYSLLCTGLLRRYASRNDIFEAWQPQGMAIFLNTGLLRRYASRNDIFEAWQPQGMAIFLNTGLLRRYASRNDR